MMSVFVLFFLPLVISFQPILIPKECPPDSELNTHKPWSGNLVKIKSVAKGSLYTAGTGDDMIYVVHVYGSPYEMGYAHGVLLKSQIQETIPSFLDLQKKMVIYNYGLSLPKDLVKTIKTKGFYYALDRVQQLSNKYTPEYFYEEMRGLADGSGVDYQSIVRFHMYPELIKGACSMIGAWGDAVSSGEGLIQLRSLDWDTRTPLQKHPIVLVYHPNEGHAFVNNGWPGWIATIAGMSSSGLAISQKKADKKRKETSKGTPFTFVMRDVLQFDNSLEEGIRRLQYAHRTSSMWMGIGDGQEKKFRLIDYYSDAIEVYDVYNVTKIEKQRYYYQSCGPLCIKNFPLKDLVYWGNHMHCQKLLLRQYYGRINPGTIMEMMGAVQSGRFMNIIFDLKRFELYVSNARTEGEKGSMNAYDRQYIKLDVQALFDEPEPTVTKQ